MSVAACKVNVAVLSVFVLLTTTFLVLAVGWFDKESSGWIHFGGYLGLLTALAAWYTSFAGVTAFTWGRQVFPVGPLEQPGTVIPSRDQRRSNVGGSRVGRWSRPPGIQLLAQ